MLDNKFLKCIGRPLLVCNQNQRVYGLWKIDCKFNPNGERCFNYKIIVIKTKYQGAAYYVDNINEFDSESIVGSKISEIKIEHNGLLLAILDSLAPRRRPDTVINLQGDSISKSVERAEIIARYAEMLIEESNINKKIDFINVGVVTLLMKNLIRKGYIVKGSDFDKSIIDDKDVFGGEHTLELVKQARVAIVTGMTMTNGTIMDILKVARDSGTKVIMFNETGAGLNTFLLDLGVDIIISEPFPFYIYDGNTTIEVHIRNRK